MTETPPLLHRRAEAAVVDLLNRERVMTIAVIRDDGWPQATTVGYYNEGLDLYFSIARSSQKFVNLQADSRASIAIRSRSGGGSTGLSMAGHVVEITDPEAAESLNQRLLSRGACLFAVRGRRGPAALQTRHRLGGRGRARPQRSADLQGGGSRRRDGTGRGLRHDGVTPAAPAAHRPAPVGRWPSP